MFRSKKGRALHMAEKAKANVEKKTRIRDGQRNIEQGLERYQPYQAPHIKPPTISSPPYQAPHIKPPTISSPPFQAPSRNNISGPNLQYQAPDILSSIRLHDTQYQAPTNHIKPLILYRQYDFMTHHIRPRPTISSP